jgi:hypothetical protein
LSKGENEKGGNMKRGALNKMSPQILMGKERSVGRGTHIEKSPLPHILLSVWL